MLCLYLAAGGSCDSAMGLSFLYVAFCHVYFFPLQGCLYIYNCDYDIDTVKNCFLGANSAYKLHLSDKVFSFFKILVSFFSMY